MRRRAYPERARLPAQRSASLFDERAGAAPLLRARGGAVVADGGAVEEGVAALGGAGARRAAVREQQPCPAPRPCPVASPCPPPPPPPRPPPPARGTPPPPPRTWSAVDNNVLDGGFSGGAPRVAGQRGARASQQREQWVAPPDNAGWRDSAPAFPADAIGVYWVFGGHELRWLPEVILARITDVCGRPVVFRHPDDFVRDFAGVAGGRAGAPPFPHVLLVSGPENFPAELRGRSPPLPPALAEYMAAHATLVHLGNELCRCVPFLLVDLH